MAQITHAPMQGVTTADSSIAVGNTTPADDSITEGGTLTAQVGKHVSIKLTPADLALIGEVRQMLVHPITRPDTPTTAATIRAALRVLKANLVAQGTNAAAAT